MYYPRLVLPIYLEEKDDQSSYLEPSRPHKKSHHVMAFFNLNLISSIWSQQLKHVDILLGINAAIHQEILHRYQ